MAIKPAINQFNGGELSPYLEGRTDWDKYNYSAKLCKNFIPLVEGSLKRRGGSHYIAKLKAKESYTIEFSIKIKGDIIPNVVLDGVIVESLDVLQDGDYTVYKTSKTYTDGQLVKIFITAEGYKDINDSFYAPSTPKEYILREKSSGSATLTIITASDDIQLKINGQAVNTYIAEKDEPITWTALYKENNASGSVLIDKDTTMVLNIVDGYPELIHENKTMVSTDAAMTGEMILAAGKYRITLVGAGGYGEIYGDGARPRFYHGYSGACLDADFNLERGAYEWRCGEIASFPVLKGEFKKPESSYIKKSGSMIAEAGTYTGDYSKPNVSYDKNKAIKTYIVAKGNGPNPEGSSEDSVKSALGDYGKGTYITKITDKGSNIEFSYYPATNGFFAITYIGA